MDTNRVGWRWWLWPLRSRKIQVAVATVLAAWGAQAGWALSEETVTTVLGVGVALILGIAHEDAGWALLKSGGTAGSAHEEAGSQVFRR